MLGGRVFRVAVLLAMLGVLLVPSVFAIWSFCEGMMPVQDNVYASLGLFDYPPEEILPGEEESKVGENHLTMIDRVLNEKTYGLNATKKPLMHEYLVAPGDIVYCDQHTTGGNLQNILLKNTTAGRVHFAITKISDTEYHLYSYAKDDVSASIVGETEIFTYKTILVKENGAWKARTSYAGHALAFDPPSGSRSIDIQSWHPNHREG